MNKYIYMWNEHYKTFFHIKENFLIVLNISIIKEHKVESYCEHT